MSLFRLTGCALRPLTLANAGAVFTSMVLMTFGAYIQPKGTVPGWYIWVRSFCCQALSFCRHGRHASCIRWATRENMPYTELRIEDMMFAHTAG